MCINMNYLYLTVLPFLFMNAVSELPDEEDFFDGGYFSVIVNHPYELQLTTDRGSTCGASILNGLWALTAAHCVIKTYQITLRAGTSYWGVGGMVHLSVQIIVHEKFNRNTYENNIAVVEVEPAFQIGSPGVAPVNLIEFDPPPNLKTYVSGWSSKEVYNPNRLQIKVFNYRVISRSTCSDYLARITPKTVCTLSLGGSGCGGDPGGPLIQKGTNTQVGIITWNKCSLTSPGVYMNIYYYKNWILSKTDIIDY